jgi:hypothetical protein
MARVFAKITMQIKAKPDKSNANADALSRRTYNDEPPSTSLDSQLDKNLDPFSTISQINLDTTEDNKVNVNVLKKRAKSPRDNSKDKARHGVQVTEAAATQPPIPDASPYLTSEELIKLQADDAQFKFIIAFLTEGILADDTKDARRILAVCAYNDYHIIDGVLSRVWLTS